MIRLEKIDLDVCRVQIPVVHIHGSLPGKNLFVSAGMDGDEYASIDAAYALIEEISNIRDLRGSVVIIPIVNIPGFEAKRDYNPLDYKYPKLIFPGKPDGSPSQRLIYWLSQNFILKSNAWVDLHGGALGEYLDPFVYIPQTGNKQLDGQYRRLIHTTTAKKIIFDKNSRWSFSQIHQSEIMHIISEAGFSADRSRSFIDFHKRIVKSVMGFMGMTKFPQRHKTLPKKIYNEITSVKSQHNGLWYPNQGITGPIKKGQLLGNVSSFDGRRIQEVISQTSGEYLWLKTSMPCTKNETLIEVAII